MVNKSKKTGNFLATIFLAKNRRGSHVGMIISFVIFITFIVFLYVVVNPAVNTGQNQKTTLDYIKSQILKNVSANFTSASININKNQGNNCVRLQNLLFAMSSEIDYYYNAIIKNESESKQDAYRGDVGTGDIGDLKINRNVKDNVFFKIYFSPEFSGLATTTINCNQIKEGEDYSIGSITTGKYIFENSIYKFIDYYKTNYEKLKTEFKISPGAEFAFDFIQADATRIDVGEPATTANVYAEEVPIQYIDNQANILSGFINIKVW